MKCSSEMVNTHLFALSPYKYFSSHPYRALMSIEPKMSNKSSAFRGGLCKVLSKRLVSWWFHFQWFLFEKVTRVGLLCVPGHMLEMYFHNTFPFSRKTLTNIVLTQIDLSGYMSWLTLKRLCVLKVLNVDTFPTLIISYELRFFHLFELFGTLTYRVILQSGTPAYN